MLFGEFPFLRYVLFFITGILLYPYLDFLQERSYHALIAALFCVYITLVGLNTINKRYKYKSLIPFLAYFLLMVTGLYFSFMKDIHNGSRHILQQEKPFEGYMAVVLGMDEPKANVTANRAGMVCGLRQGKKIPVQGEILIYHRAVDGLQAGDVLYIQGMPQRIPAPTNPGEFDYQKFMIRQQIAHQHFIQDSFHKIGVVNQQPLENYFIKIRQGILKGMDHYIKDPQANQVAKALLLGQKKNMDKELSTAYAATGAMHILAVSGLHVGIVYGFFFLFIKPFQLPTGKRILYLSLLILLIWSYAFLTGMSPSVMRAATMFSLMALAQMKSRNPSIFNAIALSALLLLLYDPFLIYAVGFQLSYSALLGILLFQPLLVNLWLPKNKLLEYVWQISTVGIAAQLATFPISIHYFHIFPSYFILSNLIAIPGAFLIMSFGIPFMLLVNVPFISELLAWIVEKCIMALNLMIFSVQQLPKAQLSDLQIDTPAMLVYGIVLAMLYLLVLMPKKWNLYLAVFSLVLFGIIRLVLIFDFSNEKELIIYEAGRGIAVDFIPKNGAFCYQNGVRDSDMSYKVLPNRRKNRNMQQAHLLKAFEVQDSIKVFLPDFFGEITFFENRPILSPGIQTKGLGQWKEGVWQGHSLQEPIDLGANAVRIILK